MAFGNWCHNVLTAIVLEWAGARVGRQYSVVVTGSHAYNLYVDPRFRYVPSDVDVFVACRPEEAYQVLSLFLNFLETRLREECHAQGMDDAGVPVISQGVMIIHSTRATYQVMCNRKKLVDLTFVSWEDASMVQSVFPRSVVPFTLDLGSGRRLVHVRTISLEEVRHRLRAVIDNVPTVDEFYPEQSVFRLRKDSQRLQRLDSLLELNLASSLPFAMTWDADGDAGVDGGPEGDPEAEKVGMVQEKSPADIKAAAVAAVAAVTATVTKDRLERMFTAATKAMDQRFHRIMNRAGVVESRAAALKKKLTHATLRVKRSFLIEKEQHMASELDNRRLMLQFNQRVQEISKSTAGMLRKCLQQFQVAQKYRQYFHALVGVVQKTVSVLEDAVAVAPSAKLTALHVDDVPFIRRNLSTAFQFCIHNSVAPFHLLPEAMKCQSFVMPVSGPSVSSTPTMDTIVHSLLAVHVAAGVLCLPSNRAHIRDQHAKDAVMLRFPYPEHAAVQDLLSRLMADSTMVLEINGRMVVAKGAGFETTEKVLSEEGDSGTGTGTGTGKSERRFKAAMVGADGLVREEYVKALPDPIPVPGSMGETRAVLTMMRNVANVLCSPSIHLTQLILESTRDLYVQVHFCVQAMVKTEMEMGDLEVNAGMIRQDFEAHLIQAIAVNESLAAKGLIVFGNSPDPPSSFPSPLQSPSSTPSPSSSVPKSKSGRKNRRKKTKS